MPAAPPATVESVSRLSTTTAATSSTPTSDGDDQRLDVGPGGDDDVLTGVEELARERHAPIMSPGAPAC